MKAPPLPPDEAARLAALESYEILDTDPEQAFDDLTQLASHICSTPVALVSLVDGERQWFKSKIGLEASETPRELAFCAHAIADNRLLVVPDATGDERFADNPLVTGDPEIRFYAGTPLVTPDGFGMGTLCVIDMQPRELTAEQLEALEALGRQVVSQLELRLKLRRMEEAEVELRRARAEALVASEAKSAFVASMSHELRTPLNAIIGYSELLEEEAAEHGAEALTPDLARIRSAGRHLLGLINDVLDLSKIEAGRIELFVEDFEVGELVREVTSAVGKLVAENGNRLRLVFPPDGEGGDGADAPLGARADVTKLRQILFNLLSNAAKFTRDGSITLTVERETETDDDGGEERIVYRIEDTGIGMTPEQLDVVFAEFRQADASTTRKFGGTGLGLAISRRLAEAMGGELTVTSRAGHGSTFTLRLPRRVVGAHGRVEPAVPAPRPVEAAGGEGTVLVIDDDPEARALVLRVLSREGYRVLEAGGGVEGLSLARDERPDAILLDVTMPSMDGWSVLSMLKADPQLSTIPVAMQTILADKRKAYALGAADYLVKPVGRARLVETVARLTGGEGPKTVLIVDADAEARGVIRRAIERTGAGVLEAASGREALERLETIAPALILVDLMLPTMDGFEFLEALRDDPERRDIPVVVLTARDLSDGEAERLEGAVHAVLDKDPRGSSRLTEALHALLQP